MLLVNNLSFKRNNNIIFHNVSFSVASKKIIHLTGKNCSGKTTLIKLLAQILLPTQGDIFWNGKKIKKNIFDYYKNTSLIMDTHSANLNLTIDENIFFWKKLSSSSINIKETNAILELLLLKQYINTPVGYLSRGEIKKLELSRLIFEQKKLWILDEPYSGLDKSTIKLINETFVNHIDNNGMIILSSHYLPQINNFESINLENYADY